MLTFNTAPTTRGAVFTTPGTGLEISGQPTPEFGDIDPSYPQTFATFSAPRLFTARGSNIVDVTFFIPGTNTPATVRGFGSVFSDVDLPNTTSIQYFDQGNTSLGTFFVPNVAGANETLSFLGVSYADPVVSRVRITSGNVALGAGVLDQNGNPNDLVVMDDLLYAEPVPEPSGLVVSAAVGLGLVRRRRRAA